MNRRSTGTAAIASILLVGVLSLGTTACQNGGGGVCDIWAAGDCGPGSKCVPETVHEQPVCRSIVSNPDQVGDPCSANGPGDSCDAGAICIEDVCRQLCTGSAGNPSCIPLGVDFFCHIYEDSGVPVCEEECDPLVSSSCSGGFTCGPASFPSFERFTCGLDDSGDNGTVGDSCANQSQCAQGHVCVPATSLAAAAQCGNNTCCTELCDLDEQDPCSIGQHDCVPFYSGGAPPGLEHVGVCVVP